MQGTGLPATNASLQTYSLPSSLVWANRRPGRQQHAQTGAQKPRRQAQTAGNRGGNPGLPYIPSSPERDP